MSETENLSPDKILDNVDFFVSNKNLLEILKQLGYEIDDTGILLDRNKKPVTAVNGEEINIKRDKELKIVTGSHLFARNIAELSEALVKKDLLKFEIKG